MHSRHHRSALSLSRRGTGGRPGARRQTTAESAARRGGQLLLVGGIVPHAPVLLPDLGGEKVAGVTAELRTAVAELPPDGVDLVVILSPHGSKSGVYERTSGSLDDFGVHGLAVEAETDRDAAARLSKAWATPLLDEGADHGVVTPLLLMGPISAPVVACTLVESTGPAAAPVERALDDASAFVVALKSVASDGRVLFIASANTSAALHPRAPLQERREGRELDDAVLRVLTSDPGGLLDIPASLWRAAGACGAGPLSAFGALFAGRPATVLGYAHPAGVGYLAARVDCS